MSARRFDADAALPWACVAIGGAWFAAIALRHPAGDGDLLWQRWLGEKMLRDGAIPHALGMETFSAPGAPWTPHEWLFSLALAWSGDHGLPWLVPALCALAVTAALAAVVLRCRRRGVAPLLAAAAPLACVLATLQSFGVRAQTLGWAGASVLLWLLERGGPWAWAAVPLTVAWANLHASVFLSPVIAALFACAALLRERRWTPEVRNACALAAACAAATLATPLGLALPRYALMLVTSPIRHSISEWTPTSFADPGFTAGALPLLLVAAAFGVRTCVRDRLLLAVFAFALFSAVRNVPVFAFVAAPIALAAIPYTARRAASARAARAASWTTLCAAAAGGALLVAAAWGAPLTPSPLPYRAAHALAARAVPARVFCEDFAWCSLFLNDRRARVFLDGRCDPYPVAVWNDYRTVLDGDVRWSAVLDARAVDAVLARRDGALDGLLARRRRAWRVLAADAHARLYVRAQRQAGAG